MDEPLAVHDCPRIRILPLRIIGDAAICSRGTCLRLSSISPESTEARP